MKAHFFDFPESVFFFRRKLSMNAEESMLELNGLELVAGRLTEYRP